MNIIFCIIFVLGYFISLIASLFVNSITVFKSIYYNYLTKKQNNHLALKISVIISFKLI